VLDLYLESVLAKSVGAAETPQRSRAKACDRCECCADLRKWLDENGMFSAWRHEI